MKQLLQIESIPIKLEVKATRAKFERADYADYSDYAHLNSSVMNRNASRLQNVDATTATRRAVSDTYVGTDNSVYGQILSDVIYGKYSASSVSNTDVSADYVQAGIQNNQMMQSAMFTGSNSMFIPSSQPVVNDDVMAMYSMDRASFDISAEMGLSKFEYVPATLEFEVSQRPEVRFEYLGSPIYVPKSAAPDYVDTTA